MALIAAIIVLIVLTSRVTEPVVPAFNADRALDDLVKLADMGPRVPGADAYEQAFGFLSNTLDSLADQLTFQSVMLVNSIGDTLEGTNLIASFNLQPERNVRVMLGAHWDSRPFADKDPEPTNRDKPVPGANDGASGTAVLLEMARILHHSPPAIGVDILLFDLEDAGLDSTVAFAAGSEQFVEENAHYRPTFGIIVDMVCDRELRLPREGNSHQAAPRIVDLVWDAADREDAAAFIDEVGGGVNDDHLPFLRRGIPVIDVIHSPFPSYWHTLGDTPDKCSAESLGQVGRVLSRVVYTQ